jgi:hypothetical protein
MKAGNRNMEVDMKLKCLIVASLGLAVGAMTAVANPSTRTAVNNDSTASFPTLRLPIMTGPEGWIRNSWLGAKYGWVAQPAHIEGKYWVANGKRICVRSEYLIKQELTDARHAYLDHDPDLAVADLLKASLLLQDDMVLAKPRMREQLRGAAIEVEHEAENVADGAAWTSRQMTRAAREARRAADEFDYARFGGV